MVPRFLKIAGMFVLLAVQIQGATLLIPMDEDQNDHLKAYGITYWALAQGYTGDWLLNYRGGSFAFPDNHQATRRLFGPRLKLVIPKHLLNAKIVA